jgi:hypothetical protein
MLLQKDPSLRPDAKSLLKMKEIKVPIIKLVTDIFEANSQIAVKIVVENNLTGSLIDEFKLQHQAHFILLYSKCISNHQEKQYLH